MPLTPEEILERKKAADDLRKEILEAFGSQTAELSTAIKKSDTELKDLGKVSEETKNEIKALDVKLVDVRKSVETELKKVGDLEARLAAAEQLIVAAKAKGANADDLKTIGDRFIEDPEFKKWAEQFKLDQPGDFQSMRKAQGRSPGFRIKSFGDLEKKDITSLDASAGQGIWSTRQPEIVSEPYRPLSIRRLIPSIPVTSNLIEYVRTKTRTSNVDYVSEGAQKPKSDLEFERKSTGVYKIAHYIKASMEVLADFPRLRSIINTELLQMLGVFEEDAILLGDGTNDTILGLIPQATTYDTGLNRTDDTRIDIIRHAILQVYEAFYPSTGIVLNPRDWERLELTKDDNGRYMIASATSTTGPRLWGLPVVESFAMPHGQFMVGSFALGAEIYDRMTAAIYVSTEDQDNFVRNMVSILAEERLGLAVKRPQSFVHGSFDDAGLSSGA